MTTRPILGLLVLITIGTANAQTEKQGASKATCDAVLATPLTPAVDPAFTPDCDSTSYYFGIGHPRDFVAARKCAFVERAHPRPQIGDMFYGSGILSMLYANGQGVPPDFSLATRFTCEENWASPAELEGRLAILKHDEATNKVHPFDLCQTATSGLSEGTCTSIETRLHEVHRLETLRVFSDTLPPPALHAFRTLQAAEDAFDDLRSSNEVDLSGTGRAAFELMERDKLREQFLINLKRFNAKTIDSPVPLATADRELNSSFDNLKHHLPPSDQQASAFSSPDGTINFDGVQKTQRAWLTLRNAWVAFATASHATATPDQVAAIITMQRVHQLQSLLP
jgi:uncharacterized protein YecT (DUF1311 family)